jgi:hypothetical protein
MRGPSGSRLKKVVQVLVLGAFASLLALGRLGLWAIAFSLGLIMEVIRPGRLYCMWLCPIRAAYGLADMGPKANKRKRAPLRGTSTIKALGWAFVAIFLILFGVSLVLGLRGWLFPSFVAIGIILSFELSLMTLCSGFCPFGAAFIIVRRISVSVSGLFRTASPTLSSDREGHQMQSRR